MCHNVILFFQNSRAEARQLQKELELDIADLHGREILTVAAGNLVLVALFEFEHGDFFGAALRDDFAAYASFTGIVAKQDFFVVRMDGQDGAKVNLFSDFSVNALDTNGVARRDAILLSPGLNNGVHRSSKS
jgi:hypothetical protein